MKEIIDRACNFLNKNPNEWYDVKARGFKFNKSTDNLPEHLRIIIKQSKGSKIGGKYLLYQNK